jgi:hypothetical protein
MSDRTESVPATQAEVVSPTPDATPAPEPSTAHLERMLESVEQLQAERHDPAIPTSPSDATPESPAPSPEAAVGQQAAQAAELAGRDEEAARKEADSTLKATVTAYRQGEKAYRVGLLEAGRLGDLYLHQRMALGDKRAAATQVLEGELAKWSSSSVDVNRLVGCYHAWRLLAEEPGLAAGRKPAADAVPYGHYRDAWMQLVQRQHKDTPQEVWALLPGMEAECRELYAKAVKDGLSRDAVTGHVKALLRVAVDREAAAKRAEAEAAKAQAAAMAQAMRQAEADAREAAEEARARQAAAEQAKAAERAQLTQAAEQAKAELLAKQQQLAAAHAERAQAEAARARAEKEAKDAAEAQRKAAEKAAKAAEKAAARNVPPAVSAPAGETPELPHKPGPASATVGKQIAASVAKDAADVLAAAIAEHETPDDVLAELLRALHNPKYAKSLSNHGKRAVEAALLVLDRASRTPAPVKVAEATAPSANGTPAASTVA